MESKKNIHWPSCFWFLITFLSAVDLAGNFDLSSLMQVVGFACMGYSSIRLVPGDLFTRKVSLTATVAAKTEYRRMDVVIQFIGLALMASSLLVRYVFSA